MSDRSSVMPSRMALTTFKGKNLAAKKGYDLLKKKSDALTARFRTLLKDIYNIKKEMGDQMKEANFSLAEAQWAAGDFKRRVLDDSHTQALVTVKMSQDNVAGVKLPIFKESTHAPTEKKNSYGLAGGGTAIAKSQEKWRTLLGFLIKLASLQTSFVALDDAIKVTNRRVNALDSVVIPEILEIIRYIESELDELEREDIFRLKKVLFNKVKKEAADAKTFDAAKAARSAEISSATGKSSVAAMNTGKNILADYDAADDEDIIV